MKNVHFDQDGNKFRSPTGFSKAIKERLGTSQQHFLRMGRFAVAYSVSALVIGELYDPSKHEYREKSFVKMRKAMINETAIQLRRFPNHPLFKAVFSEMENELKAYRGAK